MLSVSYLRTMQNNLFPTANPPLVKNKDLSDLKGKFLCISKNKGNNEGDSLHLVFMCKFGKWAQKIILLSSEGTQMT